ncbi:hypothetical protein ABPG74_008647 [Tetrahymena malaccensis]
MKNHLLKQIFGIKYPIIQAPMAGGMTNPNLVSSVCNADALGFLASGYVSASVLEKQIIETKQKTQKPFGINIFLSQTIQNLQAKKQSALINLEKQAGLQNSSTQINVCLNEEIEQKIELAVKYGIPIISFTFGIPDQKLIKHMHSKGIHVIGTATNVQEALEIEKANLDSVVLQGSEAGGHRGSFIIQDQSDEIGLISLLQVAKKKLKIPYFAAGGIASGEALLSCRILGAQAAFIGTTFLVSHESSASRVYKDTLLKSQGKETVITEVVSGKKARGVKNQLIEQMNKSASMGEPIEPYPIQNALSKDIRAFCNQAGKSEYLSLWSGQSLECIQENSVTDILQKIIKEYEESLQNIQKLSLQ